MEMANDREYVGYDQMYAVQTTGPYPEIYSAPHYSAESYVGSPQDCTIQSTGLYAAPQAVQYSYADAYGGYPQGCTIQPCVQYAASGSVQYVYANAYGGYPQGCTIQPSVLYTAPEAVQYVYADAYGGYHQGYTIQPSVQYPALEAVQYCGYADPYVGCDQQYSVQPTGLSTIYNGPTAGYFPAPYEGTLYYPEEAGTSQATIVPSLEEMEESKLVQEDPVEAESSQQDLPVLEENRDLETESQKKDTSNTDENLFQNIKRILKQVSQLTDHQLMEQLAELSTETEEQLSRVVDLVYEQALVKPRFSAACARICSCLAKVQVPLTNEPGVVNFEALLLNCCRMEFERDKVNDTLSTGKQSEMKAASSARNKAQRRSISNIMFLVELYKLQMVPLIVMHECVKKLLKKTDNESVKCLCKLLTIIGKDLEREREQLKSLEDSSIVLISVDYFTQIKNMVDHKTTSLSSRLMLKGILHLWLNNWEFFKADLSSTKVSAEKVQQVHDERAEMGSNQRPISKSVLQFIPRPVELKLLAAKRKKEQVTSPPKNEHASSTANTCQPIIRQERTEDPERQKTEVLNWVRDQISDLQVRIDHTSRTLSFGSDLNYSTEEDAPAGAIPQNLASSLAEAFQVIKPERKKLLEERKKQRKVERRNAFYRQIEEEAQRMREEQLKKEREERERLEQEQREEEERKYQERLRELEEQERNQCAQQEIEEQESCKEEERRAGEENPSKDWSEKEEDSWRRRGKRKVQWRYPVADRDWRQEGREANKRGDLDRELPFRRRGDSSCCGGSEDRGLHLDFDDERGRHRGGDEDCGPSRGFDDDRGPRQDFEDDRGHRRSEEDSGPRRSIDEDHGLRQGDDDRGHRRGFDDNSDRLKAEEERLRQEAKEQEKERIMQEHEQIKKNTVHERLEQIKKTELGAKSFKDKKKKEKKKEKRQECLKNQVKKVLNRVEDQAEKESDLQQYVPHLQNNTILGPLQQVAQSYQSIEFSRLSSLVPCVDGFQLERSIADAGHHRDLQVRIDHTSRTLSFGSDLNYSTKEDAPAGAILQNLASSLAEVIQVIKPASILQEREEQRQQAIADYFKNEHKERQRILARRQAIEERLERLESLNLQRENEELERKAELQKVRKAEEERLRQEVEEREKKRIIQNHEEIKKKSMRKFLEQIKKTELGAKAFKNIDIEELEELDPDFIMAKQVEQLKKEKKKRQEHLKNQEKKINDFERAKRLEEIPLIKKAYEKQKALEHKQRMSRMMEDKEIFLSKIKAARSFIYEEELKQFQEHFVEERKKRLEERKKQRKEERRKAFYRQKEEEAQRIREEQLKKEREERERLEQEQREEEERKNQEHLRELEEQERNQRAQQLEIEERERCKEERRASDHGHRRSEEDCGINEDHGPRRGDAVRSRRRRFCCCIC